MYKWTHFSSKIPILFLFHFNKFIISTRRMEKKKETDFEGEICDNVEMIESEVGFGLSLYHQCLMKMKNSLKTDGP